MAKRITIQRLTTAFIVGLVIFTVTLAIASAGFGRGADAQEQKPDPAQIARGAKAWGEQCGRCHNMRGPEEFTDDIWDVSVNHMRIRANLTGQMAEDIKAFLKSSN